MGRRSHGERSANKRWTKKSSKTGTIPDEVTEYTALTPGLENVCTTMVSVWEEIAKDLEETLKLVGLSGTEPVYHLVGVTNDEWAQMLEDIGVECLGEPLKQGI